MLLLLLLLRRSGGETLPTWEAVAKSLGSRSVESFAESKQLWADEFKAVVPTEVEELLESVSRVFVPFSGGDLWSAMAVNGLASDYTLSDRWRPLTTDDDDEDGVRRWNATKTKCVAEAVENILGGSFGFQLGHLVKAFAENYGMAPLLLGALGAMDGVSVDGLRVHRSNGLQTLLIRCRADRRRFLLRYVECDLHDQSQLARLASFVSRRRRTDKSSQATLTLLKGTELALTPQRLRLEDLRGAKDPEAAMAAAKDRDDAKIAATNAILQFSRLILQDSTGVPFRQLRAWATNLHAFGTYSNIAKKNDPDSSALADFYETHRNETLSIGGLRFGYCIGLDHPDGSSKGIPYDAWRRSYQDLVDHGPLQGPLRAAFNPQSSSRVTTQYYCHMLLAYADLTTTTLF